MPTVLVSNEKAGASTPCRPGPHLTRYRYWSPNVHETTWVLVVDLDHEDSRLRFFEAVKQGLPMPSWLIEKKENGHVQAGWVIEHVSTGPNSRQHPIRYARAVRYALTKVAQADEHFTNYRCWNPFWSGWSEGLGWVEWHEMTPRPLGTLRQQLEAAGLWTVDRTERRAPVVSTSKKDGRNSRVFEAARLRTSGTVREAAEAANAQQSPPMSAAEVAGIVRSIEGFEARHGRRGGRSQDMSDQEREKQRQRGQKGGSRDSAAQRTARAKGTHAASVVRSAEAVGRSAQARALRDAGYTAQQIADRLGCSRRTAFRLLARD